MLGPPEGAVPGVASGPRAPGPSDSPFTPSAPQDQAEHRASSGRLPAPPSARESYCSQLSRKIPSLAAEDGAPDSDQWLNTSEGQGKAMDQELGT